MIENGPASEHEMVLAFLQAEFSSPRFGPAYASVVRQLGICARIVANAELTNEHENFLRKQLLAAVRGYGTNQYLFTGFPAHVQWRHVTLLPDEIGALIHANHETWNTLSAYTRRVSDGAKNLTTHPTGENARQNITAVSEALRNGATFPALIAVTNGTPRVALVEGHTRATASVLANTPARLILGTASAMNNWAYW